MLQEDIHRKFEATNSFRALIGSHRKSAHFQFPSLFGTLHLPSVCGKDNVTLDVVFGLAKDLNESRSSVIKSSLEGRLARGS